MLCTFVVLRSRFAFHKAVVLECAYMWSLFSATQLRFWVMPSGLLFILDAAVWQHSFSLSFALSHVACAIHSVLWSGLSWNKVSPWTSLLCLTLWSVYMNQIWELMSVKFPRETQWPRFSPGCCMPLSKCWLLSAKLNEPAVYTNQWILPGDFGFRS